MPRYPHPSLPAINPDGHFGFWFTDERGQPAYEYTNEQATDPLAETFTTQGPSRLHWHQLGNQRLTAVARNSGEVVCLESSRGLMWLNRVSRRRRCPGGGIALVTGEQGLWSDLHETGGVAQGDRRVFGEGYFLKQKERHGLRLTHTLFAPFGDDPALISHLVLTNTTPRKKTFRVFLFHGVNLHYMTAHGVYATATRTHYLHGAGGALLNPLMQSAVRLLPLVDAEEQRHQFAARFRFEARLEGGLLWMAPHTTQPAPPRQMSAEANHYPSPLFLAPLQNDEALCFTEARHWVTAKGRFVSSPPAEKTVAASPAFPCLCVGHEITLAPGASRELAFVFGYAEEPQAREMVKRFQKQHPQPGLLKTLARNWGRNSVDFQSGQKENWLRRETRWHGYHTQSAALYDTYYENHYLLQGGPYEFLHGFRGAVRDLAMFAVALVYVNPALAREVLAYNFRLMSPQGRLMYAAMNFGQATGAGAHENPSDLSLFLLWALTEYVFVTGDWAFLNETSPFFPRQSGKATHLQKALLALRHFHDCIGLGEHGLVRASDGDWSDGISFLVKNRRVFLEKGESCFVSAMALYVLPRVAALLRHENPTAAAKASQTAGGLKKALMKCFNGQWFYRGYDGAGAPIGEKEIFLEHHVWLLISRALPRPVALKVVQAIREKLDDPQPFGQRLVWPYLPSWMNLFAPGSDVNGGVWCAINYLLCWGYAHYDKDLAWRAYVKNSMAMKATLDPHLWYGIFSGPDSVNASDAERPGEAFFHLPTPGTDFAVMNVNRHAMPLLALFKMAGLEPGPRGLPTPRPLLPHRTFSLKTPMLSLKVQQGLVQDWRWRGGLV